MGSLGQRVDHLTRMYQDTVVELLILARRPRRAPSGCLAREVDLAHTHCRHRESTAAQPIRVAKSVNRTSVNYLHFKHSHNNSNIIVRRRARIATSEKRVKIQVSVSSVEGLRNKM